MFNILNFVNPHFIPRLVLKILILLLKEGIQNWVSRRTYNTQIFLPGVYTSLVRRELLDWCFRRRGTMSRATFRAAPFIHQPPEAGTQASLADSLTLRLGC